MKDTSNPYFTFDPSQVHRLLALRARVRRNAGHLRADHRRARLRVAGGGRRAEPLPRLECVSCGACVQACPTATLTEKSWSSWASPSTRVDHHLRLLRRGLLVPAPRCKATSWCAWSRTRTASANHGHSCVEGSLRLGLRHPPGSHHQADDPQSTSTTPGSEVSWDEAVTYAASEFRRRSRSTAAIPSAASPPAAAPTKKPTWCRNWCAPRSATTTSTPVPGSATRRPAYGLQQTLGESAGTQEFRLGRCRPT